MGNWPCTCFRFFSNLFLEKFPELLNKVKWRNHDSKIPFFLCRLRFFSRNFHSCFVFVVYFARNARKQSSSIFLIIIGKGAKKDATFAWSRCIIAFLNWVVIRGGGWWWWWFYRKLNGFISLHYMALPFLFFLSNGNTNMACVVSVVQWVFKFLCLLCISMPFLWCRKIF